MTQSMENSMDIEGMHFPGSCIGILADLWAKDGVNQKDLGISLIKTKSSINKMLTALELEGLIIKINDPLDGRGKRIHLTSKGKALQSTIESKSKIMEEKAILKCSVEEIKIAKKVLSEMYDNLRIKEKETQL